MSEEENSNKPSNSMNERLRKRKSTKKPAEWRISGMSSSESDYSPDGSEDDYLASAQQPKTKSLRGILAYQASRRQKGAFIHTAKSVIPGESYVLLGVSSRGQISGRGRFRGRGRGGPSFRRTSASDRAEMLAEHSQIVENLCAEDETMPVSNNEPMFGPNFIVLTDGK